MKNILLLFCFCSLSLTSYTQSNKGINFQGIARYSNGFVVADKTINLRLSILNDTIYKKVEYQEIKSVTTNILGLFTVVVGSYEIGKIITSSSFDNINWTNNEKYLMVEVDLTGDFSFITLGMQKINYVPFAFYADKVEAKNVVGILSLAQGGTGFASIKDIKNNWQLDKVNNTLDSEKPASASVLALLNDKLNKTDTSSLSSRMNQKLNNSDTLSLSNRINLKLNKLDTLNLSNRINVKLNSNDTLSLSNRINLFPKSDTSNLSNRINLKLNSSDTLSLSNRINLITKTDTNSLSNRINLKLNSSDTLSLSNRINLIPKIDTTSLSNRINQKLFTYDTLTLSNRINLIPKTDTNNLSNRINLKLNSSDTLSLSNRINLFPKIDTTSLSNRINLKLNKLDTIYLSNRINQKLNSNDTLSLSNRINQIPKIDTSSLSNRINNKISLGSLSSNDITQALNYTPVSDDYGSFYDTTKQQTAAATALSIKFNFTNFSNNINVTNNTSGLPSRITVTNPGIYNVKYTLQFIKSDAGTDDISVWVRRNSIAYANTHNVYTIQGSNVKNVITASCWVDLGVNDYIEIYFSNKNTNSCVTGSAALLLPSRPATPSAIVSLQRVN